MSKFWSASGTIEALGNSDIKQDGTLYSVVKLRTPDGKPQTMSDVVFMRRTHVEAVVGGRLDLLGFTSKGKNLVYAVVRDGEVSEDIEQVGKTKKLFLLMAAVFIVPAVVLAWTIIVPILALPAIVLNLVNASRLPGGGEMRRELARHLAARGASS